MTESTQTGASGAGDRRIARHWRRHCAGTGGARLPGEGTATTTMALRASARHWRPYPGCRAPNLDVNDVAAVEALMDSIVKQQGGLHVLVNNAGITRDTWPCA